MNNATPQRGWLAWAISSATAVNVIVGLASRRALLQPAAYGGRYATVAAYIVPRALLQPSSSPCLRRAARSSPPC